MRGPSVAALAFLAMLSSCALVSGLDRLTIQEDRVDASSDGGGDVADDRWTSDARVEADAAVADADAGDGEAGDAASIRCGTTTCPTTSNCCNVVTDGKPSFTCVTAGTCTGSNHYVMRCDESSCPSKQKCCVNLQDPIVPFATSAACASTCSGATTTPLCKSSGECTLWTCKAAPYGLTGYQACGP